MDNATIAKRAGGLLMDPQFLFRVSEVIGSVGVVGEKRNCLIVFLAVLTTVLFAPPVSILVKARSAAGKSNLLEKVLKIFYSVMVVPRSGFSREALNFGKEELDGRVLYIPEIRAVKVAQSLLRLLQSEGVLTRERTSPSGQRTVVTRRVGCPVVLTTTTDDRLFVDDETRFLSLWLDESPEQTRAIAKAKLHPPKVDGSELAAVQRAVWALLKLRVEVKLPSSWLEIVIDCMPGQVRVRRDVTRFLRLLQAITLTRYYRSGAHDRPEMEVEFSDYAVAWCLLNDAFTCSASDAPFATGQVVSAAETIFNKSHQAVSVKQIAAHLAWKQGSVYPHLNRAVELGLLRYDGKSRQNNEKRYIPTGARRDDFLVSPQKLLEMCPQLEPCEYVNPITGNTEVVKHEQRTTAPKRALSGDKPKWEKSSSRGQA